MGLFGSSPSPPPIAPTPVMPAPNNTLISAAQKTAMGQAAASSGRSSTIITPTTDNTRLGQ